MSEMVQYDDRAPVTTNGFRQPQAPPAVPMDPTGGRLVAWARSMQAAHQIGTALCETAFVPQAFRGKPDDAAAAILFGDEIGFTPTQALRSVYVIGGNPALYARAMVALVLSKGHEIWTVEDTPGKVTVAGRRRGTSHTETVTWTTDRAQKAGYTSNKKYLTDSQGMLYARASGDVARRIAPDVLAGCPASVEELELAEGPSTTTVTRGDEPKRTVQRAAKAAPPPVAEPDFEDPPAQPAAEPAAGAGITAPQSKMLHASLRDNGITDRDLGLAFCSDVVGRDIASTKELTKADASAIIDKLAEMKAAGETEPEPNPDWATGDES